MSHVDAAAGDVFDLTIIGGGPVGLFAAYYAGMRHMRTKIIDCLEELGGQLTALYPEKYIFDVPGFPKVLARDLVKSLVEQAMQYSPTIALGETVQTLEVIQKADGGAVHPSSATDVMVYKIVSNAGVHLTKTLLICAGAGAFSPKKLTVPGAEKWENNGVHYAVRKKAVFADKDVLMVGGGDSAIDWALNLQDVVRSITLIHRRNVFRAHEDSVRKLLATPTKIMTFCELEGLIEKDGRLVGADVINNQTKEKHRLNVDEVVVQIGFNSSLGPIKHWPLEIERGSIRVGQHMETELPGIFAAGDVATFDGKLRLIATGFGEAAVAVNYAKHLLDPHAKVFPGHSSELGHQSSGVTI